MILEFRPVLLSEDHDGSVSEIDEYRMGTKFECRSKHPTNTSQNTQTACTSCPMGIATFFTGDEAAGM